MKIDYQGSEEYTCSMCEKTFGKTRSDDEAMEEMRSAFGAIPIDQCSVICDDCFQKVRPENNKSIFNEFMKKLHASYRQY